LSSVEQLRKLMMFKMFFDELDAFDGIDAEAAVFGSPAEPEKKYEGMDLEALAKVSTTRHNQKTKQLEYLLHRPTVDFEYEKCAVDEKTYKTEQDSVWGVDVMAAVDGQKHVNPVVSCWVPEASIKGVPNPHENVGAWDELGKNPFTSKYRVVVAPGAYEIYQEVKE
jgi:hypothetical protein